MCEPRNRDNGASDLLTLTAYRERRGGGGQREKYSWVGCLKNYMLLNINTCIIKVHELTSPAYFKRQVIVENHSLIILLAYIIMNGTYRKRDRYILTNFSYQTIIGAIRKYSQLLLTLLILYTYLILGGTACFGSATHRMTTTAINSFLLH